MAVDFDVVVVTTGGRHLVSYAGARTTIVISGPFNDYQLYPASPRIIACSENVGWDKAVNAGLALSTAPYVVLMNDDTEAQTPGWLEKMREVFESEERVGLVGPSTDQRWPQGRFAKGPDSPKWVMVEPVFPQDGVTVAHCPLSFFCVMLSRECIVDVGYMDERFAGWYGCSDDDYQIRAHQLGWKSAVRTDVYVHHEGTATFGVERRGEEAPRNQKLLREKWRLYL